MFQKRDVLLIACILAIAGVLFAIAALFASDGTYAVVRQNDRVVACLPLDTDAELVLEGNTVVVENGQVYMRTANCAGGDCLRHAPIKRSGESIVCLPNRVTVTVTDRKGEEAKTDAIAG